MTQISVEFLWFLAFDLWTLGVYLLAKYLGQGEAYEAGYRAGHSSGYDLSERLYELQEYEEPIAGLWSDGNPQIRAATILPPKGEV